jgi:hypothetical protein
LTDGAWVSVGRLFGVYQYLGKASLGYQTGRSYPLIVTPRDGGLFIQRVDGSGHCPYVSASAFWKYWKRLRL